MSGHEGTNAVTIGQPREASLRLREHLRWRQAHPPEPTTTAAQRCEIICKWISGNINPRYQFRAIIPSHSTRTVIVDRSPVFQSDQIPVPASEEAQARLEQLTDKLRSMGWEVVPDANGRHWYSRTFERKMPSKMLKDIGARIPN